MFRQMGTRILLRNRNRCMTTQTTPPNKSDGGPMSLRSLFLKSAVVDNEKGGSIARDMLANERTFLAWLRTSLGCVALSVPLHEVVRTSDSPLIAYAAPVALSMSMGLLGFSTYRYFNNCRMLLHGKFQYNRRGVLSLSIISLVFSASLLAMYVNTGDKSLIPVLRSADENTDGSDTPHPPDE